MSELCVGIRGVDSLKHELDRTRESLRDTDATIEKLTGRPAFAGRPFARRGAPPRPVGGDTASRGRGGSSSLFNLAGYDDAGPPPAKRLAGAFGRLGLPIASQRPLAGRRARDEDEDDELLHKPSLQSSVIATPRDPKSREDAIAQQQSGAGGKVGTARNRRMFGLLLGTLVKFREDERTKEQQAEKRKAVELRLEEKQREERDRLKRERFQLFNDRRRHQAKLRALEQKMELVEIHSAWESETHSLEYFIRTTSKPHVFFLPKSHTPESQSKFDESKRVLHELITERRKQLEEELEEIMKEDKDHETELLEEYGGSENEADNSEMADPDTGDYRKDKSQEKTTNEESDLDENDIVGVDYEQSFAPESAHDVSAANESMQADVSEEVVHETVVTTAGDKDAGDGADVESEKPQEADISKNDLLDASVPEGKADVQHSDEKRKRQKHRDDESGRERRRRDSSRSRKHHEKRGSRDSRRRDKERKHSRSEHQKDRDDDDTDIRREQRTKDDHKKKPRKKTRGHNDRDSEPGDQSKHSVDEGQRSP